MFRLINKLKSRKGFTLIELIVVLAVLAIIMAIAVPRFIGVQEDAKVNADYASVASIAKAAELYYIQHDDDDTISLSDLTGGGYIEAAKLDLQSESFDMQDATGNGHTDISITTGGGVTITIDGTSVQYPDNR